MTARADCAPDLYKQFNGNWPGTGVDEDVDGSVTLDRE
jgi:hypothetical protein